jgi:3-hydroxyacyl-[acyl-carrier protein] dehydratase/trans-2-decenoyl-[acyl-carrier protein] isomerase
MDNKTSTDVVPVARQSSLSARDLDALREGTYGPNFPRLPADEMGLMTSVTEISDEGGKYGGGFADAFFEIPSEFWVYRGHFRGDPIMPGTLQVDALLALTGLFGGWVWNGGPSKGRAVGFGNVKMRFEVKPPAKILTYHIDVKSAKMRGPNLIVQATGSVFCDGQISVDVNNLSAWIVPA